MSWNFDISTAPRGNVRKVKRIIGKNEVEVDVHEPIIIIAAGSGGVVTVSRWLPKEERWNMFTKAVPPIAWMEFPQHPQVSA